MSNQRSNKNKQRKPQLSKREYEKLRRSAWEFVVVKGHEQNHVAELLNVSPVTVSNWSNNDRNGTWKEQREARMQCQSTEADNVRKLIQVLSKQRLELEPLINDAVKTNDSKEEASLRRQASSISDEMSKQNKVLLTLDKSSYTLGVYIDVMDDIFNSMRQHDENMWEKTIPFQQILIRRKTQEIG